MGYELWTSPVTGYRRHGTRLSDFNQALGDRLTARDICEPLQSCPADARSSEMAIILRRREFDVAGVRNQQRGAVVGWVSQKDLTQGQVSDHLHAIRDVDVIDADTPLRRLFAVFKGRPFVFVRVDAHLSGILTRADLNKPMVRVYLFGLISLLEIHMGFWVAKAYPDDSWTASLSENRLRVAETLRQERANAGQNLSLFQCLQFCDKQKLLIAHEQTRMTLQLGTKRSARVFLSDVEALRNSLAHSQYDLTAGGSWEELIELVERVEAAIAVSDELVEQHALAAATDNIGALR